MKNLFVFVLLLFAINNVSSQTTVLKENSAWFTLSNKFKVSDKFSFGNVVQLRRVNFMESTQVFLVKPSITYELNKNVSFGIGYMLFKSYPNGVHHTSIKKNEDRIWQHITINSQIGKTKLNNRFVFEERFKDVIDKSVSPNVIDGTTYAQRFRYRMLVTFNTLELKNGKHILGKVSNEIRIRFNTGLSEPDFDQNNFGAYLGYKILDNSKVWMGYGRDYYKVSSEKFVTTNILHFAMSYDFDLRKK